MTLPPRSPQLLIGEANLELRGVLHQGLCEQGYMATEAASLEQVLRLVHRQPFDLIVTEPFTPHDQETLARLLPLGALAHATPIVVVSTWLTVKEVRQHGFCGVLRKPFDWDELITTVAESLNQPWNLAQLPQVEIAKHYIAALGQRDVERILALCTEDVRLYPWIVPAYPAARPVTGRAAARVYLQELRQYFGTYQVELAHLYPCPHGVAARVLLRWYDPAGALQQQMVGQCLQITADGQISQVGLSVQDERLQTLLRR